MRYRAIWLMAGMIGLWMVIMGGTIALDFHRVQQSNQATAELEWTFICDAIAGDYAEIDIIDGGEHFIGRSRDAIENTVIDAKGRALSDTYDSLEPLGDGYVRFENEPMGTAVMEDGRNKRAMIGVLDDQGQELPEEEALEILYGEESGNGSPADDAASGKADAKNAGKYTVKKGDRKYVGVQDSAGNWIIPPAFHEIKLSPDQQYAIIKNGSNIGIAVLGE